MCRLVLQLLRLLHSLDWYSSRVCGRTLGPIVARMLAGAICGAGLSILFGFAVGSHTITANFLYWLALVPGAAAALGLIGAIRGASFVIAFTREE
jgi:hypothetical protein